MMLLPELKVLGVLMGVGHCMISAYIAGLLVELVPKCQLQVVGGHAGSADAAPLRLRGSAVLRQHEASLVNPPGAFRERPLHRAAPYRTSRLLSNLMLGNLSRL